MVVSSKSIRMQRLLDGDTLKKQVSSDKKKLRVQSVKESNIALSGILKKVAKLELPVPSKVIHKNRYDWPLNISVITNKHLRNLMSYYTAQFTYCNYSLAKIRAILKEQERILESCVRRLRTKFIRKGHKRDEIGGLIERNKEYTKMINTKVYAEGLIEILSSLKENYEKYITSCSREMTERGQEYNKSSSRFSK